MKWYQTWSNLIKFNSDPDHTFPVLVKSIVLKKITTDICTTTKDKERSRGKTYPRRRLREW